MTDRNVKCFITIVGLYFITKDVGALVLYSRRKAHTEYPKMQESKEDWFINNVLWLLLCFNSNR